MDQISLLIIFLLSVLYLPIVQQLAKGWNKEHGTWNKEQLGEEKTGEMIIKESKRRLVVAVCLQSPLVLHSSPEKVS